MSDRPLIIGGIEIPCYVLSEGTRVITQRGFQDALGMSQGGGKKGERKILQFLDLKAIKPLISNDLRARAERVIQFKMSNGVVAVGYEAMLLQEVVRSISKAYLKGILTIRQEHIGKQCEILDDGFSKVGVIALIDEATGFQKVREQDALQQLLNKFLLEERAKWVPTYPPDFFEMIFKMKGWTWHYASTKKPQVVGHYINDFVYSRLAPRVLEELKIINPSIKGRGKKHKNTQFISGDYGHPLLKEHLKAVTALGRASGYNWNNFKRLLERAFPKFEKDGSRKLELPFNDDE